MGKSESFKGREVKKMGQVACLKTTTCPAVFLSLPSAAASQGNR
jgi:hypothetical protein